MVEINFSRMTVRDINEVAILLEKEEVVSKGCGREAAEKCLNSIAPYVGYLKTPKNRKEKMVAAICYEVYERLSDNRVIVELSYLAVLSSYQGQGIGKSILEFAAEKVREKHDIHRAFVFADRESAGFYEKMGFSQARIFPEFWDKDEDMIMMVRKR